MSELLAPAGNHEAFLAAIYNGANAIYIGLNLFSARAYANNFTIDEVGELVEYAHLRKVLLYITMNTIVFENELPLAFEMIDRLAALKVDALIIQDLALLDYTAQKYPYLEVHASTQMGIDDLEGINLLEKLNVKRVVLAREVSIDKIRAIKAKSKMMLETFIHGALCVSYSGNCLMSGLIGMRSGNRGRCVGSCRKQYNLVDLTSDKTFPKCYLLSMKDLNTTSNLNDLQIVDSLKIEGRMKEPTYVASVVRSYRFLLDHLDSNLNFINENLKKTFNRTFTKGYLFGELPVNITNVYRPNNFGYYIGKVKSIKGKMVELSLENPINQGDQIRFDLENSEVNLPINKIYDRDRNFINSAKETCFLECTEHLNVGCKVFKTKDRLFLEELEKSIKPLNEIFPVNMYISIDGNRHLNLTINYQEFYGHAIGQEVIEKANNSGTTYQQLKKQLEKLGNTPYYLDNLSSDLDESWFIPVSILNNLRREAVIDLNNHRLERDFIANKYKFTKRIFPEIKPEITVSVLNEEQYNACLEMGITNIYYHNIIPRNEAKYSSINGTVLVGGLGGLYYYQKQDVVTDYSFNVVNAESVNLLHNLGAKKVTISHEINRQQIKDLLTKYYCDNDGYPNLEMIVYGHQTLLTTKYCPLKKMGECGKCHINKYELRDEFGNFPIISNENCSTSILNGKTLNLIDDINTLEHINYFRLAFTTESTNDVKTTIQNAINRLNGSRVKCFNNETDTRGHFNKEIL